MLTASDEVRIVCLWSLKGSALAPVTSASGHTDQWSKRWIQRDQSTTTDPNPVVVTEIEIVSSSQINILFQNSCSACCL